MDFLLRPARPDDAPAIRSLVRKVQINPTGLDWQRFVVITGLSGELVACGQIKPHMGGLELASIAVDPGWRKQGLARRIIEHLLAATTGRLYLTCRAELAPFYARFGFRPLSTQELEEPDIPAYFRRVHRLAGLLRRSGLLRAGLLVMGLDRPS